MREFNYELKQLCQRNRDGSYSTRANRERILDLIANQLQEMGFKRMHATSLKAKHVQALVARWHAEQIAPGTFKNRMAQLRWLAEKNGTPKIISPSNDAYGIADRVYVTNVSKAIELDRERLARITDPYTEIALELQREFGFRRKESIMMRPAWADRGDLLVLRQTPRPLHEKAMRKSWPHSSQCARAKPLAKIPQPEVAAKGLLDIAGGCVVTRPCRKG